MRTEFAAALLTTAISAVDVSQYHDIGHHGGHGGHHGGYDSGYGYDNPAYDYHVNAGYVSVPSGYVDPKNVSHNMVEYIGQ